MIMTPDVPTGPWRVVVGVSGSIAAYKAPFVVRRLRQAGHEVRVVATDAASARRLWQRSQGGR